MNLGPIINTTANEMVPAFSRDGHLLFFASNRLPSSGGVDIWVSRREHTHDDFAWQPAENLGAGVNSLLGASSSANKRLMARSARQSSSSN
jgi:hypothetical protein